MEKMKRKFVLIYLRTAGYHNDAREWTRLYIENRVSRTVANEEWQRGAAMKQAGIPCACYYCKNGLAR